MIATDWDQFYDRAKQAWEESALLQYSYADLQTYLEHLLVTHGAAFAQIGADGLALLISESAAARDAHARIQAARLPLSSRAPYRLADRCGPRLVLWLYGPLSDLAGNGKINADLLVETLHAHSDALGIYLRIDSSGGSLSDARRIAEALMRHRARVVAIIDRTCWSAAVYIATVANRILIRRDATMMVHPSRCSARGDSYALSNRSIDLHTNDLAYQGWLRTHRARINPDVLRELWKSERVFGADEAVRLGFADTIIPALPSSGHVAGIDNPEGDSK
jgi:ATP-dependent protease ClpP protease subunit